MSTRTIENMRLGLRVLDEYRGNCEWFKPRTLFLCRHGSHAYGTNGPDSDVDVKGVFMAPKNYVLGTQGDVEHIDKGWQDLDCALYDLRTYVKLALDNNPNILELLFIDPSDWLFVTDTWQRFVAVRHSFLSQNVKNRYCGYAVSQLKRIRAHRRWLLDPPQKKPERADYGLTEQVVIPKEQREAYEDLMKKVVESWQVDFGDLDDGARIAILNKQASALADMKLSLEDQYVAAGNKLGLSSQAMELLKKERQFKAAVSEWQQYQTWLRERSPVRAALEAKFGYDTKHGMHLVRLMRQARELLEKGTLIVKRPDAEELKAIRHEGTWSFEQLEEWGVRQDAELEALKGKDVLPRRPDRDGVDKLTIQVVQEHLDKEPE